MTIRLTNGKCQEIITLCIEMLNTKQIRIQKFARLIGKLVATELGFQNARLFMRPLEKIKEQQ